MMCKERGACKRPGWMCTYAFVIGSHAVFPHIVLNLFRLKMCYGAFPVANTILPSPLVGCAIDVRVHAMPTTVLARDDNLTTKASQALLRYLPVPMPLAVLPLPFVGLASSCCLCATSMPLIVPPFPLIARTAC